ncbi:MAG TPA: hypothetical protein VMS93_01315 [Candidatus Saccharimonadales bacterium]|nr:hypothetical protein [Candidatus Saccharimonadales bacterium]
MKAFVFTDKALTGQAGQFAWLEINTERGRNASILKKLGVQALPTFFVLSPRTEKILLRWVGGATVGQFQQILADGRLAYAGKAASGADAAMARADAAYGTEDYPAAAKGYREALAEEPASWPRHGRAVESLLFALQSTDQNEEAVRLVLKEFPRLRHTSSAANLAGSGLDGALSLPKDNPNRKAWADSLEALSREVLADPSIPMSGDDRSSIYGTLVEARHEAGDSVGARQAAETWAAFLEGEAARAATPEQRAVFDSHRVGAYLELGQPERAIPMLEASERDLPEDYNPPARLAVVYRNLKRWDEALAASDRALKKAYGPRKLGMLQTRAEIYLGKADTTAALQTLRGALADAEALPEGQRSQNLIGGLKRRIGLLEGTRQ